MLVQALPTVIGGCVKAYPRNLRPAVSEELLLATVEHLRGIDRAFAECAHIWRALKRNFVRLWCRRHNWPHWDMLTGLDKSIRHEEACNTDTSDQHHKA